MEDEWRLHAYDTVWELHLEFESFGVQFLPTSQSKCGPFSEVVTKASGSQETVLSCSVRSQLQHIINIVVFLAEQLDSKRKELNVVPDDIITLVNGVFCVAAQGRFCCNQLH